MWQAFGGLNHNAVYTIPNYACNGCTRMRFQFSDQFTDACGPYALGETEDYDVMIRSNTFCSSPNLSNLSHLLHGNKTDEKDDAPFAEIYEPVSFEMFPNPADEHVNISIVLVDDEPSLHFQIVDVSGRNVFDLPVKNLSRNSSVQIPTSDLANGLYQVVVTASSGSRQIKKLVIAR